MVNLSANEGEEKQTKTEGGGFSGIKVIFCILTDIFYLGEPDHLVYNLASHLKCKGSKMIGIEGIGERIRKVNSLELRTKGKVSF